MEIEEPSGLVVERTSFFHCLLYDNHAAVVLIIDPVSGAILDANRAAVHYYGWSLQQLRQMSLVDINTLAIEQIHHEMENVRTLKHKHFKFRHRRADGSVRDVAVWSSLFNHEGKDLLHSIIHDISDQITIEEDLRESEERYRRAEEMGMVGNWEYDPDKMQFWGSAGTSRIFGLGSNAGYYTYDEVYECICDAEDRKVFFADVIKHGKPYNTSYTIINKCNAQKRIVHSVGELRVDSCGRTKLVGVLQDITESKKAQEALVNAQKLEALGVLSGGIAHDFNNILGAIIGFADLSIDSVEEGSRLHKNLHQILRSAERAKDLVNQILSFSRQAPERTHLMFVYPVLREVMQLLRATLPSSVEIKSVLHKDTFPILGNVTRIHEIVMNLCVNAAYAMKDKGILEVQHIESHIDQDFQATIGQGKAGFYSVIEVKDHGCGIPADLLPRIFEPFFTTKPVGEGTGLGLAVVAGVVQDYGGSIIVESVPGNGTTFRIFLPKQISKVGPADKKSKGIQRGTERVIFIDDEYVLCEIAQDMLSSLGYTVATFTDTVKAREEFRLHSDQYDIVITDQTMPVFTGIELAREFLSIRAEFPILLCTGYSKYIDEDVIRQTGIRGFCLKPVSIFELSSKIREILDSKPSAC